MRDLLFGDIPLARWVDSGEQDAEAEPWRSFAESLANQQAGATAGAIGALTRVLDMSGLESRHQLQAWAALPSLGVEPDPSVAKDLFGVVVEVGLDAGTDIVAGYADHTARYLNRSGAAIIWEAPREPVNELIDGLLEAGGRVLEMIGPWEGERPDVPGTGAVRTSMLTPGGLEFGEGPIQVLAADPLAGPVFAEAAGLMQALISSVQ
jgi:hypothetical protein